MRDKLIVLLGGIPRIEYSLLKAEYDGQRDLCVAQRRQISDLEQRAREEREERQRLQELIFHKFGIVEEINPGEMSSEPLQPLRTGPTRWGTLKRAMERDDARRVAENA